MSNFSDEFYRRITPDYGKAISISSGFIAHENGYIMFEYWNGSGYLWGRIYVNNILVYYNGSGGNYGDEKEHESGIIQVGKGDIITFQVEHGSYSSKFIPFKN